MSATVIEGLNFSNKNLFKATRLLADSAAGVANRHDISKTAYDLMVSELPQEQELGRKLLEQGAQSGDICCIYNLALAYLNGAGGPVDIDEGYLLLTQLATDPAVEDSFRADSLFMLGQRQLELTPPDYEGARLNLTVAGNYGSAPACFIMGMLYEADFSPFQNLEKAAYWYGLVSHVDERAAFRLAQMHLEQVIEKSDAFKAIELLEFASHQIEAAKTLLDKVTKKSGLTVQS